MAGKRSCSRGGTANALVRDAAATSRLRSAGPGFQLDRGYDVEAYDHDCRASGLELVERWATWDREPFTTGANYAVSVHRDPLQVGP